MSEPPPGPARWTSAQRTALFVLVVTACASLTWTVHPWFDAVPDASLYLSTARSLLRGEGYSHLGQAFVVRPPGFALLLAPPLAVSGESFRALNLAVSLLGVAAVALLFAAIRPRVGALVALATALCVWFNPAFQRLCNQVLSDVPGAAAMFGCLVLDRWARRTGGAGRHAWLGTAIAGAAMLRTANLLLAPAILLQRLLARRRSEAPGPLRAALWSWAPLILIPLATQALWAARNAAADVPTPTEQVYLHSYPVAMLHEVPGDPDSPRLDAGDLLARVPAQLGELVPRLGRRLRAGEPTTLDWVLGVGALGCGLLLLVRRRDSPELQAGLVLLALATYFAWKDRLALPLYLLLLPAAVEVVLGGVARLAGGRVARPAVAVLLGALALVDAKPHPSRQALRQLHEQRAELATYVAERFPDDAPLAAPHGWHLMAHLDRQVFSLQIAATRESLGPDRALQIVEEEGVVGVAANLDAPLGGRFVELFRRAYREEGRVGSWVVFRVPRGERE